MYGHFQIFLFLPLQLNTEPRGQKFKQNVYMLPVLQLCNTLVRRCRLQRAKSASSPLFYHQDGSEYDTLPVTVTARYSISPLPSPIHQI